jgi:hypothetical protein
VPPPNARSRCCRPVDANRCERRCWILDSVWTRRADDVARAPAAWPRACWHDPRRSRGPPPTSAAYCRPPTEPVVLPVVIARGSFPSRPDWRAKTTLRCSSAEG